MKYAILFVLLYLSAKCDERKFKKMNDNEKFNDFTANKLLDIIMKNKDRLNVKEK